MDRVNFEDTIVAISTPLGKGGIGIIRLSGENAIKIADKIYKSKNGTSPYEFDNFTIHYGWIIDRGPRRKIKNFLRGRQRTPKENQKFPTGQAEDPEGKSKISYGAGRRQKYRIIDEVLLTVMRAPKTYTKEDIVEINSHSGIVVLRKILDLVIKYGARLAEPGEFTKRAFINGRIDLIQAEAVLDIVNSKTEMGLKTAIFQLGGDLSKRIEDIKDEILKISAPLEASLDFPDEEIDIPAEDMILKELRIISKKLENLINTYSEGKILRDGILTVICGKTNVGKSSLMNAMLKDERVIVTSIPGTTRDAVEEFVNVREIPLKLVDTAGIIEPHDIIETEGVQISKKYLQQAELILFVIDGSKKLDKGDDIIKKCLNGKEAILVVNKNDLPQKINNNQLNRFMPCAKIAKISALNKKIDSLKEEIEDAIYQDNYRTPQDILVTNFRHKQALEECLKNLLKATEEINKQEPLDFVCFTLIEALKSLNYVTGELVSEEILNKIFSQFCIGK